MPRPDASGPLTQHELQELEYVFPYHHVPYCTASGYSSARVVTWGHEYLSYIRFVLDLLDRNPFNTLIDVGCGDGRFLSELTRRFGGRSFVGLDYSERAIQYAKAFNPTVRFLCADVCSYPALQETYDVATAIEVLEHIPSERLVAFVKALHRLVSDSGKLILTVPAANVPVTPKHWQHFSAASLACVLTPYFEVSEVYFTNRVCIGASLLQRLLANRLFVLNDRRLAYELFKIYEAHFLRAREGDAQRICVLCVKVV